MALARKLGELERELEGAREGVVREEGFLRELREGGRMLEGLRIL